MIHAHSFFLNKKVITQHRTSYNIDKLMMIGYLHHRTAQTLHKAVSVPSAPHPWRASGEDPHSPTGADRRTLRRTA